MAIVTCCKRLAVVPQTCPCFSPLEIPGSILELKGEILMATHRITAISVALITIASLAFPTMASAGSCGPSADQQISSTQQIAQRQATACLINEVRASHHLRKLHSDARLAVSAIRYSQRLVANRFFAHVDAITHSTIETRDRGYTAGAAIWALGENLAWATGARSTPRQILAMWMASPGHRENLLDPQWNDLGVGVALGTPVGASGATYSAEFGVRAKA